MRKKAKAIAITKTKLETKSTLFTLLLLVMVFGVLLYFRPLSSEMHPEWIGVLDQYNFEEQIVIN